MATKKRARRAPETTPKQDTEVFKQIASSVRGSYVLIPPMTEEQVEQARRNRSNTDIIPWPLIETHMREYACVVETWYLAGRLDGRMRRNGSAKWLFRTEGGYSSIHELYSILVHMHRDELKRSAL